MLIHDPYAIEIPFHKIQMERVSHLDWALLQTCHILHLIGAQNLMWFGHRVNICVPCVPQKERGLTIGQQLQCSCGAMELLRSKHLGGCTLHYITFLHFIHLWHTNRIFLDVALKYYMDSISDRFWWLNNLVYIWYIS